MKLKGLFLNANNQLEGTEKTGKSRIIVCSKCGVEVSVSRIRKNNFICPKCGHYFTVRARRRILMLVDKRTFVEMDSDLLPQNILNFPGYEDKLQQAEDKSREKESVVCGVGEINGITCCIFSMEARFMMGSMGAVTGEKITRIFEYATENHLPVLGITVSGGARMQEGMISLMQMSKVSAAVKRHSDHGNLYITLLTNPTTGGVDASFAMQGDIILAEPRARVGFAGPRVIEKTLNQKLPEGFQLAEHVMSCGFIDEIVPRDKQKEYIGKILQIHQENANE